MQDVTTCAPGRRSTLVHDVAEEDTAASMRSGDVPVLATPKVLSLAEEAAVASLRGCIDDDHTTVGSWVEVAHMRPSRVGTRIVTEAVLMGVHGRRLEFSISLHDGDDEVAHVKHRRIIVERAKFASV